MAEKDNYPGSLDEIQEQIRKLEKQKEVLEVEKRKQLEQELYHLRSNVQSHKNSSISFNRSTAEGSRKSMSSNRDSEEQPADLNASTGETLAQLRALQQSVLNTSGGTMSSILDDSREDSFRSDDADDDVMTPQHKLALRTNRELLVECMTPDDIFNDLISKHILTNADVSRIKDKNTTEAKNEELLNMLVKRSDKAFHVFVASLRRTLQGWLANKLDPPQQRNKRKRATGEVNINLDCERVVPVNRKRYSCTCQEVEEQILIMAKGAFANVRRRDASAASFEQFKKELKQTNEVIKESMEIMNTLKILCRHGELTDLTEGSVCFTIRCPSLAACQELWHLFESGDLLQACQEGLVTPYLLKVCDAKEIVLSVRISRLEYLTCALELAYKEMQVLQKKRLKITPIKKRLRQRVCDSQKENSTARRMRKAVQRKGQAFKEIPVNITSPQCQSRSEGSWENCIGSNCSDSSRKSHLSSNGMLQSKKPVVNSTEQYGMLQSKKPVVNSTEQYLFSDKAAELNDIWLRSHGKNQCLNAPDLQSAGHISKFKSYRPLIKEKCKIRDSIKERTSQHHGSSQIAVEEDICPYNLRDRVNHLVVIDS